MLAHAPFNLYNPFNLFNLFNPFNSPPQFSRLGIQVSLAIYIVCWAMVEWVTLHYIIILFYFCFLKASTLCTCIICATIHTAHVSVYISAGIVVFVVSFSVLPSFLFLPAPILCFLTPSPPHPPPPPLPSPHLTLPSPSLLTPSPPLPHPQLCEGSHTTRQRLQVSSAVGQQSPRQADRLRGDAQTDPGQREQPPLPQLRHAG